MTEPPVETRPNGFSVTISAPSLGELAVLAAQVSYGLDYYRRIARPGPHTPVRSFQWTKEEEATVLRMKAERATWREIADSLGRTEKAVLLRWNRIRPGAMARNVLPDAGKDRP